MCGIAGMAGLHGQRAEAEVVARMCARLRHRGPDDEGRHAEERVVLGQRRLSIIDLSTGQQPLSNEDGTVWITFNGEIYNFQELRRELRRRGHVFRTAGDTEAIVHLYEEHGAACVERLRGMFAFAIWDARRREVVLARDHVGKKPLFYALRDGRLLFASELQALVPELGEAPQPDLVAVDEYLTYGYIPAPRTGFVGVRKLPPAHVLTIPLDGASGLPEPRRYWRLEYGPKHGLTADEAEAELRARLESAVRRRLIADVPLGALLSGGIDSSLVVALMSSVADGPVRTFSIGFDDRSYDELPYARRVAATFATEHHELTVRPQALDVLPLLVRHYGEPYADSSAVPSYYVSRLTRQHVTVALNGDGGDEALGGYDRYLGSAVAERYRRLPGPARRLVRALLSTVPDRLHPRNRLRQARRLVEVAEQPLARRYARWMTYFPADAKASLYTPEYLRAVREPDQATWLRELLARSEPGVEGLDRLLAADVESYLPFDLLVKMDIASMANGLEARSPFLDVDVLEFCARLPSELKVRGRALKWLSKRLAARFLPPGLVHRRKMGFGVPLGAWLRSDLRPLVDDVLLGERAAARGLFTPAAVRTLVTQHAAGHDHAFALWSLLWLELWFQEFIDGVRLHAALPPQLATVPAPAQPRGASRSVIPGVQ